MRKFIINPVTNEYESIDHKPTTSDLMKEIGRPDVAKAIDKITKKKITGYDNKKVGALDVASAQSRDILSEQLMYKFDASTGKFFNGNGQSVNSMAEANKLNDETAIVAPGGEGKQFQEQYKKDNSPPTKIPKLKSDNEVLIEYYKTGSPQQRAQYLKYKRASKELDKRLDKEMGIIKEKKVEVSKEVVPKIELELPRELAPQEDVRVAIKRLADQRLAEERKAFGKIYGFEGIAGLKVPQ